MTHQLRTAQRIPIKLNIDGEVREASLCFTIGARNEICEYLHGKGGNPDFLLGLVTDPDLNQQQWARMLALYPHAFVFAMVDDATREVLGSADAMADAYSIEELGALAELAVEAIKIDREDVPGSSDGGNPTKAGRVNARTGGRRSAKKARSQSSA